MNLYVDILFGINFSMDFLALFVTSLITHKKIYKARMLIASSVGALYAVLSVIWQMNFLLDIALCILVAVIMCLISFYEKRIGKLLLTSTIYWGVSATLGGIMSLLYTQLNKILSSFITEYTYESTYQGARFIIIVGITALASIIFGKILTYKKEEKSVQIEVTVNGEKYKMTGFCDSGNLLTDPFTGKGVILVSENSKIGDVILKISDLHKRYIPYNDVSGSGMVKGIVPNKTVINDSEVEAIIATVKKDEFNGYEALVPTSLT